mmetsp:Transcript_455/g.932  ORF Transcript_455/g.932 Transcript_455/m.932 type:complete len:365 (+) Transcript_455:170-1264(+)
MLLRSSAPCFRTSVQQNSGAISVAGYYNASRVLTSRRIVAGSSVADAPASDKKMMKMVRKQEEEKAKAAEKALKMERKQKVMEAEGRGALYLLHWRSVVPKPDAVEAGSTDEPAAGTALYIASLKDDLKKMEKVAKDAIWFTSKEGEDGQHVLMVTAKVKHAHKYKLVELPAGEAVHTVQLGGSAGQVEVPVGALREMLLQQRQARMQGSDDSDESDDECMTAAATMTRSKDEKKKKAKLAAKLAEVDNVPEDPAARQQAMALVGQLAAGSVEDKEGSSGESSSGDEGAADCKAGSSMAGATATSSSTPELEKAARKIMEEGGSSDDSSSCSSSSSGSEDEEAMQMQGKGQKSEPLAGTMPAMD